LKLKLETSNLVVFALSSSYLDPIITSRMSIPPSSFRNEDQVYLYSPSQIVLTSSSCGAGIDPIHSCGGTDSVLISTGFILSDESSLNSASLLRRSRKIVAYLGPCFQFSVQGTTQCRQDFSLKPDMNFKASPTLMMARSSWAAGTYFQRSLSSEHTWRPYSVLSRIVMFPVSVCKKCPALVF
jgi:hypothetical protein